VRKTAKQTHWRIRRGIKEVRAGAMNRTARDSFIAARKENLAKRFRAKILM
jgi:hypothetical protein